MNLGILAYATKTGLGYQTLSYYKWLKPKKTLVVDISMFNNMPQNRGWYPDAYFVRGIPHKNVIKSFLKGLDVMLFAETPLNFEFYSIAKEMNVKTVSVENPEFFDHIIKPELPLPDEIILPSVWMEKEIREYAEPKGVKVHQIHHPVDRDDFPFRLRETPTFVHIAGKPATHDRNGTIDYLMAEPRGLVITQDEKYAKQLGYKFRHSRIRTNIADRKTMYDMGDILVLPRKYAGNCLPLNEALSCGLPVIMTDISPNNNILPKEWLVEAKKTGQFQPRTVVDIYSADINKLREKIEWFKTEDIKKHSQKANEIAESISWQTLLPKYLEVLK